jgi:hypothetical protein
VGQPVAERWNGLFCENFLHDRQKQTGKQQTSCAVQLGLPPEKTKHPAEPAGKTLQI